MLSYHARLSLEYLQASLIPKERRDRIALGAIVRHVAFSYALSATTTEALLTEVTQEAQRRGLVHEEGS